MFKIILAMALGLISFNAFADTVFVGIGVVISKDSHGNTNVDDVVENGPAARAGIVPGDTIKAVDGLSVQNLSLDDVSSKIRGPEGSQVTLTIVSAPNYVERDVKMVREMIVIVDKCFMEGSINLRTNASGPVFPTSVSGTIGSQYVNWQIFSNRVSGSYKGEMINLGFDHMGTMDTISGSIHNTYVRWNGNNGSFFGTQTCIP